MSFLELNKITKVYPSAESPCLDELDMSVEQGEIVAVLGASGCGKTTLLKIAAGLERQDSGTVVIDGDRIDAYPAEKRPVSMVFQKALLFRNMNVEQNVSFSPRMNRTMSKAELKKETEKMLELVRMEGTQKRRVTELSGGQEQRISLARALITRPKLLLLDEPLSALDANLKLTMEAMIRDVNAKLGTTMLYVTHDQTEASAVADRIALMDRGRMIQLEKPESFYRKPANLFAARFFGWQNFITAEKTGGEVSCALGRFPCGNRSLPDGKVILCIRAEAACRVGSGQIKGSVRAASIQGTNIMLTVDCGAVNVSIMMRARHDISIGAEINFDFDEEYMWPVADDKA